MAHVCILNIWHVLCFCNPKLTIKTGMFGRVHNYLILFNHIYYCAIRNFCLIIKKHIGSKILLILINMLNIYCNILIGYSIKIQLYIRTISSCFVFQPQVFLLCDLSSPSNTNVLISNLLYCLDHWILGIVCFDVGMSFLLLSLKIISMSQVRRVFINYL